MTNMTHLLNGGRHGAVRYGLAGLLMLAIGLAGLIATRPAYGHDQDIQKLNRFVQTSTKDTPAMQLFRAGRDLIEVENWPKAAEKFSAFVSAYANDKDMDAALYWLAYSLKKQQQPREAARQLARLMKDYPRSSWRGEAEAMLTELAPQLGNQDAVNDALKKDNEELKIIALQSLFEADEERAAAFVGELLKPNSNASPTLKAAAVSLLGSHGGARAVPVLLDIARNQPDLKLRLTAIKRLGEQNSDTLADDLARLYDAERTPEVKTQILRAFSEMHNPRAEAKLIEVARSGESLSMRQLAIRYLGEHDGTASLDELIRIFDADRTPEIRAQILRALSERDDPRAHAKLLDIARHGDTSELRMTAIRRLSDRGASSVDDLLQLYAGQDSADIKQSLLRAYSEIDDARARAKLAEIARGSDTLELRLYAIRRLGEHNDAQTITELTVMYDAERDPQVRATLIHAFGDSHEKSAIRKLIAIARSDSSVELRKLAVRQLGESKDPEALKFLEDLLK